MDTSTDDSDLGDVTFSYATRVSLLLRVLVRVQKSFVTIAFVDFSFRVLTR